MTSAEVSVEKARREERSFPKRLTRALEIEIWKFEVRRNFEIRNSLMDIGY